jgi:hypothetical protein
VQVCHGVASRSRRYGATTFAVDGERRLVSQTFASWNRVVPWLRAVDQPEPLTTPSALAGHLSISADGRRVAYASFERTAPIETVPFDPVSGTITATPVTVVGGTPFLSWVAPSPDGQWLVDEVERRAGAQRKPLAAGRDDLQVGTFLMIAAVRLNRDTRSLARSGPP